MPPKIARWMTFGLAAVSGFVSYLAFKPAGLWFLAPAAVAGLYLAVLRAGAWRSLAVGLVFGLAQFLPLLGWAYNAAGPLPYLALAIVSALGVALGPFVYGLARPLVEFGRRPNRWLGAVGFAFALTAADTLRSFVPFGGFPWGRIGFTQATGPLGRWAFIGGVPLVGLAVALLATLAVAGVMALADGASLGAGIAGAVIIGVVLIPLTLPIDAAAERGTLTAGAVQGDVDVTAEGLFAQQRQVLENHVEQTAVLMSGQAVGPLDVVLWPENSTDIDPRADSQAKAAIDHAATLAGAPLLVGAMEYTGDGQRYNQGLLWVAGQGVVDLYAKQHPAPFAEYMPARSFFRLFTSKVDLITTDMLAGDDVGVLDLEAAVLGRTVALGDVICFEVAYDAIVAETVRAGAEVVIVQTNNASFGR
ncbi:MAG: apolipoprotein N-acyltransferase, partial [Bifidobacteriaceae bacterium]|nr:apolipoprotein N-acyltransferase [Bifidobacteriaceae bacterium]